MDDRGEKIVTLAREMLRTDMRFDEEDARRSASPLSFRMLFLATLIAALGSSAVTEWAAEARRPLNRYEKTELNALIFYAARLKSTDEQTLRADVASKFNLASLDDLDEHEFLAARRYLQDEAR